MMPYQSFRDTLRLTETYDDVAGDVAECGVWRGGMIAAMAEILGSSRKYWLFDSFEGLPPAREIDGEAAIHWQNNPAGEHYHDNCRAEQQFAHEAMQMSGVKSYQLIKGWFNETLPGSQVQKIAILRLDADWYDSTMCVFENLYDKVSDGGLILIDDYYFWDGCSRAVHDFLASKKSSDRIQQMGEGVAYIIKNKKINHFGT